jgi:hypothetical protein
MEPTRPTKMCEKRNPDLAARGEDPQGGPCLHPAATNRRLKLFYRQYGIVFSSNIAILHPSNQILVIKRA